MTQYLFHLPTSFKIDDILSIKGTLREPCNRFDVRLLLEKCNYSNVAYQIEGDFSSTLICSTILTCVKNIDDSNSYIKTKDLFCGTEFHLQLKTDGSEIIATINGQDLSGVSLEHDLADINYIELSGDIAYIDMIKYEFNNYES